MEARCEGEMSNGPLSSSVLVHGRASNSITEGFQALILQDLDAYDATLCTETYRKLGLPCPPSRDPTVQWLKQVQPTLKSAVFMQTAEKACPFVPLDRCRSSQKMVVTGSAYLKLVGMFASQTNRLQDSEWGRLERKMRLTVDSMRNSSQPILLSPHLSFVSHGYSEFSSPVEAYNEWSLCLVTYAESLWNKDAPLRLTLRYEQPHLQSQAFGGSQIELSSHLLGMLAPQVTLAKLRRYLGPLGYFTAASEEPRLPPPSAPDSASLSLPSSSSSAYDPLPPASLSISLSLPTQPLPPSASNQLSSSQASIPCPLELVLSHIQPGPSASAKTDGTNGAAAKKTDAKLTATLAACGLADVSSDDDEDETDSLAGYALPVVATTAPPAAKREADVAAKRHSKSKTSGDRREEQSFHNSSNSNSSSSNSSSNSSSRRKSKPYDRSDNPSKKQ